MTELDSFQLVQKLILIIVTTLRVVFSTVCCICWPAAGESSHMAAGSHRFPFTFVLPETAPSSFEGDVGYVRYTAEAKMERPWKFDHVTRSAFTVISLVDLNLESPDFKVTLHHLLFLSSYYYPPRHRGGD